MYKIWTSNVKSCECNWGHHVLYFPEVQLCPMEGCLSYMPSFTATIATPKFPRLSEVTQGTITAAAMQHPQSHSLLPLQLSPRLSKVNAIFKARSRSQGMVTSDSDASDEGEDRKQKPGRAPHLLSATSYQPLGVYPGVLKREATNGGLMKEETDTWSDDLGDDKKSPRLLLNAKELCFLLLTVTKDLCHEDCRLQSGSKKYVSMIALQNLAQLLSSLHLENVFQATTLEERSLGDWMTKDLILLERYLVRVIVTLSSYIVLQPNGVSLLQASGVLNTLTDVAKSVLQGMNKTEANAQSETMSLTLNKFVMATDAIHGLLLLFHNIFSHLPVNLSALSSCLKLFNEIIHSDGLEILEGILLHWEQYFTLSQSNLGDSSNHDLNIQSSRDTITSILATVSKVATALKKSKVGYIHTVKCTKRKHRQCDYGAYLHHHHDILGLAGATTHSLTVSDSYGSMEGLNSTNSYLGGRQDCVVAVLGYFLLGLFQKATTKLLHVRLLCTIEEGGLCCCMSPSVATSCLLNNFAHHSTGVCGYILTILVKVILNHLGGSSHIQLDTCRCSVCRDPAASMVQSVKTPELIHSDPEELDLLHAAAPHEASDSAFSGSDMSLHEDNIAALSCPKWRCMRHFQSLVLHDNDTIGVQVMQHVLRLVSHGSHALLQEIFHQICLPVIETMKSQISTPLKDVVPSAAAASEDADGALPTRTVSDSVVQYMLSALPTLLQCHQSQIIFLNYGGVRQLCLLVHEDGLRQCVLKVFQVLIVLEERRHEPFPAIPLQPAQKFDPEHSDQTIKERLNKKNVPSNALESTLLEQTAALSVLSVFLKMLFTGGVRLSKSDVDSVEEQAPNSMPPYDSHDIALLCQNLKTENHTELAVMCDLWSSAETLFGQSRRFRKAFTDLNGQKLAFDLLSRTLELISGMEDTSVEASAVYCRDRNSVLGCWLALIHASLGICLASCKLRLKFGTMVCCEQFNIFLFRWQVSIGGLDGDTVASSPD